ncbi:unnamed protein product [Parajaminaea phylloscopi]
MAATPSVHLPSTSGRNDLNAYSGSGAPYCPIPPPTPTADYFLKDNDATPSLLSPLSVSRRFGTPSPSELTVESTMESAVRSPSFHTRTPSVFSDTQEPSRSQRGTSRRASTAMRYSPMAVSSDDFRGPIGNTPPSSSPVHKAESKGLLPAWTRRLSLSLLRTHRAAHAPPSIYQQPGNFSFFESDGIGSDYFGHSTSSVLNDTPARLAIALLSPDSRRTAFLSSDDLNDGDDSERAYGDPASAILDPLVVPLNNSPLPDNYSVSHDALDEDADRRASIPWLTLSDSSAVTLSTIAGRRDSPPSRSVPLSTVSLIVSRGTEVHPTRESDDLRSPGSDDAGSGAATPPWQSNMPLGLAITLDDTDRYVDFGIDQTGRGAEHASRTYEVCPLSEDEPQSELHEINALLDVEACTVPSSVPAADQKIASQIATSEYEMLLSHDPAQLSPDPLKDSDIICDALAGQRLVTTVGPPLFFGSGSMLSTASDHRFQSARQRGNWAASTGHDVVTIATSSAATSEGHRDLKRSQSLRLYHQPHVDPVESSRSREGMPQIAPSLWARQANQPSTRLRGRRLRPLLIESGGIRAGGGGGGGGGGTGGTGEAVDGIGSSDPSAGEIGFVVLCGTGQRRFGFDPRRMMLQVY